MTTKARNLADLGSNDVLETTSTGVEVTGDVSTSTLTIDGTTVAATATELNYIDGVTSSIQTQLDGKATTAQGALADSAVQPDDDTSLGDLTVDQATLKAIVETKADSAVDVFVYDTRKDSDGGAWRKRTQHTSWYNETLNTATRGSRKEFPSVAVIVVDGTNMKIYDGDDPSLPMWMVFTRASGSGNFFDATQPQTVEARNGIIYPAGAGGSILINFISEYNAFRNTSRQYNKGNIAERNSGKGWETISGATDVLLNNTINDIAMTVLPNAPIDSVTGLPTPTIAVATDGGVSVIKDDGTVVNITTAQGSSYNYSGFVEFYLNKLVFGMDALQTSRTTRRVHYHSIPSSDISFDVNGKSAEELYATDNSNGNVPDGMGGLQYFHAGMFAGGALGGDLGVNSIDRSNNMFNYITSDYNTGWMNGDIKLATLSDTDATDITSGPELVTNGTFDTNSSGWSTFGGASGSTASNGVLIVTQGTTNYGGVYQAISVTPGKQYVCSVTSTSDGDYAGLLQVGDNPGGSQYVNKWPLTVDEPFSFSFTANTSTIYINLRVSVSVDNVSSSFDNVSLVPAEEDRSVNGNGLQVFGTVTKTPVATGADLVAYSGFSGTNYLMQPYNSDLDFGTGDFCVMGWAKKGTSTLQQTLLQRDALGLNVGAGAFEVNIVPTTGLINALTYDGTSKIASSTTNANEWCHIVTGVFGGNVVLYVNGVLEDTTPASAIATDNDSVLMFGVRTNLASAPATTASLALWRISATAPTAEQIKKMYNDEKVLFQENAKATLYGTSDAVTALAYDEDTELLHVGTGEGRSVFQGLRRVDNTTDAVGAAISASNGIVVED